MLAPPLQCSSIFLVTVYSALPCSISCNFACCMLSPKSTMMSQLCRVVVHYIQQTGRNHLQHNISRCTKQTITMLSCTIMQRNEFISLYMHSLTASLLCVLSTYIIWNPPRLCPGSWNLLAEHFLSVGLQ